MLIARDEVRPRQRDFWPEAATGPGRNQGDPVFFAVQPDTAAGGEFRRLAWEFCDRNELRAAPIDRRCLHATLLGVGVYQSMSPEHLLAVRQVAATVVLPRFSAGFDWVERFVGPRPPALAATGDDGVFGLRRLQAALVAALRNAGFTVPQRRYRPHVTLLYAEHSIPEQRIEAIRWPVREFVLIRSHFGRGRHTVLDRWPLGG